MGARDNERRQQTVFEQAFRFSALIKPDGEVLEIDRQALSFWQLSERDLKGKPFWDIGWRLVGDEQAQRLRSAVQAAAGGKIVRREAAVWHHGGQKAALSFSLRPLRDSHGDVVVLVADARNLTRRHQVEDALKRALVACEPAAARQAPAHAALAHVDDAVLVTDAEGLIEYINPAAAALLDQPAEAVQGRPLSAVLDELGPETEPLRELVLRSKGAAEALPQEYDFRLETPSRRLSLRAVHAQVSGEGGFVLVLRTLAEETHPSLLGRDALTGLLNRGGLMAQLTRTLLEECTPERRHTLVYLDLDGFEQVNRELGPHGGDEALRQVAQELRGHARHGDVVARLGGDDFVLLLRDCAQADARTVAEALLLGIHELTIPSRGPAPQLSISAGLVELQTGVEPREALRAGKRACLQAKEAGGNRMRSASLAEPLAAAMPGSVQAAFEDERVQLFQQPLVALDGRGGLAHAEVLLRLRGEDGEPRNPQSFLSLAEHNDLMPSVDRWVIRRVFAHCRGLRESGAAVGFSINLSYASLGDSDLLGFIRAQKAEYGVDPAAICFEISEPVALADMVRARAVIEGLHEAGFQVALDDCGNGGHSLSYLRDLPVDFVKIGGELVRTLVDDPVDNVLVDAINRIGHLTGKRTIGKCVENDATVKRLRALQVDFAQGFGLAEPMRLEARV